MTIPHITEVFAAIAEIQQKIMENNHSVMRDRPGFDIAMDELKAKFDTWGFNIDWSKKEEEKEYEERLAGKNKTKKGGK